MYHVLLARARAGRGGGHHVWRQHHRAGRAEREGLLGRTDILIALTQQVVALLNQKLRSTAFVHQMALAEVQGLLLAERVCAERTEIARPARTLGCNGAPRPRRPVDEAEGVE